MEDLFTKTFEKHRLLMVERVSNKEKLTDKQNTALKKMYVIFRDVLNDVFKQAKKSGITSKNCDANFEKFLKNYTPNNFYVRLIDEKTLKLSIPEDVKKALGRLKDTILIKIVLKDEKKMQNGKLSASAAGLEHNNGRVDALYVRADILIKNFEAYKSAIQHEVQHIVSISSGNGLSSPGDKLDKLMAYLGHPSEIAAYSKEYAYNYFKKYPKDKELDFEKFKKSFRGKKDFVLDNYVDFGENLDGLRNKYDLSKSDVSEMKRIYEDFVFHLKLSFHYFQ